MVLGDLQVIIGVTIFLHWGARVMNWGVDKLGGVGERYFRHGWGV